MPPVCAGPRRSARVVEQAIDLAELFDRERNQGSHLIFDGDVGLTEDTIGAELFRQRLAFRHAAAGNDDLSTLSHEDFRCTQSDATGRPSDHRNFAAEPSHALSSSVTIRNRS